MLSSKHMRARGRIGPAAGGLTVALAVAAAGCSSDVTRFKLGNTTTGSIPVPNETVGPGSPGSGPGATKSQGGLSFVLDGPRGVEPVHDVAPAEVEAALKEVSA